MLQAHNCSLTSTIQQYFRNDTLSCSSFHIYLMCGSDTSKPEQLDNTLIDKEGVHYESRSSIESDVIKVS